MLAELLPEEKRKLHELEQQLIELELGNVTIYASDIALGLQQIQISLNELEKLVLKESKGRKDDFRRRLQHLRLTYNHLKDSLDTYLRRSGRRTFDQQKTDLLQGAQAGTTDDLALEMAENGSLQRSGEMINEYISVGQATLSDLLSQKERLKAIQRKAFDILNYLGISNSLMRMIERRETVDKWIVYIGMLMVVILLFFIWFYFVRK